MSNKNSFTLVCDDDWQLEAHKMRNKYMNKTNKMSNIINVTLASDDDSQREAHKARQQIYYTTTKQNELFNQYYSCLWW